jgi:hypothetical protein
VFKSVASSLVVIAISASWDGEMFVKFYWSGLLGQTLLPASSYRFTPFFGLLYLFLYKSIYNKYLIDEI